MNNTLKFTPTYEKLCPLSFLTFDGKFHLMKILDDFFGYRETESMSCTSSTSFIDLIKTVEYMRKIFFRDTDACISDRKPRSRDGKSYRTVFWGEFLCISDDIADCCKKKFSIKRYLYFLLFDEDDTLILSTESFRKKSKHNGFFWIFDIISSKK